MPATVIKLPWVHEIGESFVSVKASEFEELRDWALRIHSAYLLMVDENVRLHSELRKIKQRVEE